MSANMVHSHLYHTATLIAGGKVLVAGGIDLRISTSATEANCEIFDPNGITPPTVTASGSPTLLVAGQSVLLNAVGIDPNGASITYAWDFGDGSTSTAQNPAHAYAVAGTYDATVTVTDSFGAAGVDTVIIQVYALASAPVARFTTSDVVAFVGLPFTFDGSFSTDPGNNITSYRWSFGDGTPDGSGQVISKIYNQAGPVTATLTIADGIGLTNTVSSVIQVLPADQIGLFNASINYKTSWDRNQTNADSLTMSAVINVGDATVVNGSPVALEIAGQRFTGTLDQSLRDTTNPDVKWQVKANLRGKPFGEVTMKVTIKHANLGLGFNQAGAVEGTNPHDVVTVDIPVHIEAAGRSFDVMLTSDFKFHSSGTKANGSGTGPN